MGVCQLGAPLLHKMLILCLRSHIFGCFCLIGFFSSLLVALPRVSALWDKSPDCEVARMVSQKTFLSNHCLKHPAWLILAPFWTLAFLLHGRAGVLKLQQGLKRKDCLTIALHHLLEADQDVMRLVLRLN